MPRPVAKSFAATLERLSSRLNWVIIRIPLDVPKIWGTGAAEGYRNLEAHARRIAKAVQDAAGLAEKRTNGRIGRP